MSKPNRAAKEKANLILQQSSAKAKQTAMVLPRSDDEAYKNLKVSVINTDASGQSSILSDSEPTGNNGSTGTDVAIPSSNASVKMPNQLYQAGPSSIKVPSQLYQPEPTPPSPRASIKTPNQSKLHQAELPLSSKASIKM